MPFTPLQPQIKPHLLVHHFPGPLCHQGACSISFDGNGRSGSRFEARRVHRQIAEEVSGGLGILAPGDVEKLWLPRHDV